MVQAAITFEDRVRALEAFKFTPRQAQFVATVALHGGYCLRRHYAAFAGIGYGRIVRDFLDSLVARRLADRAEYRAERGYLYHIYATSIYRSLGEGNNRNRRRSTPDRIATKLMLLDFVLTRPDVEWYVTERDKVALFTERLNIPKADLPQRLYSPGGRPPRQASLQVKRAAASGGRVLRPLRDDASSTRYFVQKLPIYVAGDPLRVYFVVPVTEPHAATFDQFLEDHARLLSHLASWAIIAVVPKWARRTVGEWRAVFHRFLDRVASPDLSDPENLKRYFTTRRWVDANDLRPLSVADLNHFRETRRRLGGSAVETLYSRWLADGDHVLFERGTARPAAPPGQLLTYALPFDYEPVRAMKKALG